MRPNLPVSQSFTIFREGRAKTPTVASERYYARSTVLDGSIAQAANINTSETRIRARENPSLKSTVFLPPEPKKERVSPYKPRDLSPSELFGNVTQPEEITLLDKDIVQSLIQRHKQGHFKLKPFRSSDRIARNNLNIQTNKTHEKHLNVPQNRLKPNKSDLEKHQDRQFPKPTNDENEFKSIVNQPKIEENRKTETVSKLDRSYTQRSLRQKTKDPLHYKKLIPKAPEKPSIPIQTSGHKMPLKHFKVTGLTNQDDTYTVKELCQGIHVVSFTPECDTLSGNFTGSASLLVRESASIDKMKIAFAKKGLGISPHPPVPGRQKTYTFLAHKSFLDPFVPQEAERLPKKQPMTKQPVRPHLLTSEDNFGSSPGVGRTGFSFTPPPLLSKENPVHAWNSVKNIQKSCKHLKPTKPGASFMSPTVSSRNKSCIK